MLFFFSFYLLPLSKRHQYKSEKKITYNNHEIVLHNETKEQKKNKFWTLSIMSNCRILNIEAKHKRYVLFTKQNRFKTTSIYMSQSHATLFMILSEVK